ncbi:hypothetical protein PFICI_05247 [Pestalotiopsis fici W106-1]|uniref:Uncharacterized protein n=1 Tax=Pestalotiopsis fici (strain W106-1 / CGMCC3.15140) TaxID=1229662 RepID=W3XDU7_PESFW|nr:uncharacterized protein PFICI_05247 [Pestalotiopsis fici W106-1]ETS83371.1 hypothetical protein PFICI_05247 [Pestalotiopsis fici W106-1]
MFHSTIQGIAACALLATTLVGAAPLLQTAATMTKRDTAERYIFANCINNVTSAGYAAIFWYYPDFLPDFPEPQDTAYVNNATTVDFAGTTVSVSSPFTLKAVLPADAATAAEGDIVSTDASASSFAGPMAVVKGSGDVFYIPATNVNCYEEYWQRDNQPVEDP